MKSSVQNKKQYKSYRQKSFNLYEMNSSTKTVHGKLRLTGCKIRLQVSLLWVYVFVNIYL